MSVVGVHTFHKDELCRAVGARIDFSGGRRLRGLMNENKERWINIEEVAEYIGVSPVTVRYWLQWKEPAWKKGGAAVAFPNQGY